MTTRAKHPVPETGAPPETAPAYLLGNDRYAVLLTRAGAGYSACDGVALNRWLPDPLRQTQGFFLYVRDLDSGACWSAGFEPVARPATRYDVHVHDDRVEFLREDDRIETRLEIWVPPDDTAELRRLTLTDRSGRVRRLDVTSYLEVVLADLRSDAAHPVFSKLFVQTAWQPERQTLLAWRRPRDPHEAPPWLVHRMIAFDTADTSFETDRRLFLGRGRSPADPRALDADATLSGAVGSVLDPVCSIRRAFVVPPYGSVTVTALLGAAADEADAAALADRYSSPAVVDAAIAVTRDNSVIALHSPSAIPEGTARWAALALPHRWVHAAHAVPQPPTRERAGDEAEYAAHAATMSSATCCATDEHLRFFNGHGGFTDDGLEYVIRLEPGVNGPHRTPVPWTNVVANERIGFLATESGAGYTWAGNSRRYRLTPWSNDPVTDSPGEALYIRDDETGEYWSPTPSPVPGGDGYEVRHGLGYTRYRYRGHGLDHDLCLFVPRSDRVKVARLTLHNRTDRTRPLSVFAFARWVLGGKAQETARDIVTRHDPERRIIYALNRSDGHGSVSFASLAAFVGGGVRATADRGAFLGPFGTLAAPAALASNRPLDGRDGADLDPCAAFEAPITLAAGETTSLAFLLGHADTEHAAAALAATYDDVPAIDAALDDVRVFWRDLVGGVQVSTPSPEIDLMVNGWLAYQTLSCRIWGRSAFYQSGGAFGFRDQLQDAAALIYLAPELTRAQILLHAAHQFREGDVLHWWHPPDRLGIRTRFSDDLLWLPYITAFYVRATGDESVLDEVVGFLSGRVLEPDEDEISLVPNDADDAGSVYEHCCRALDRSLTRGSHGLPLMGVGDWNDGMNRVGRQGRGESVWLGFFLYDILDDIIPIAERRDDADRAARYRAYQRELLAALNDAGWDGAWYRRAYYDDGTPLGSAASDECRIDAIAQAWAVISGAAPPHRAARALDALEEHLVSEQDGLIRLLKPPFDRTPHDPGYIRGYLPGVRENGGQYTHGALWAVRALAEAGRTERAARLLAMLSPVSHGRTPAEVAVYQAEPYVIAADVYGEPPHVGRAGWSWYTGSSGWMLRVALESVLGFELAGRTIRLRPRIPPSWPGYRLGYRVPGTRTRFDIEVSRGASGRLVGLLDDVIELDVEGDVVVIPLGRDERVHRVLVSVP